MLKLTLKAPGLSRTIGPVTSFRLVGNTLQLEGEEAPLATLEGTTWVSKGARYRLIDCHAYLFVRFEDEKKERPAVSGPRHTFQLRGLHAFAGRQLIASYVGRKRMWHAHGTNESWKMIVITAAQS